MYCFYHTPKQYSIHVLRKFFINYIFKAFHSVRNIFSDSADTDITDPITDPITEIKLGTPPSATFVKITEPSESIDVPKVIDTPPKSGISTTEKPSKSKRTTAGTPPYTTAETRPQTVSETHGTIQEKETGTTTRGMIDRKEAGKVSSGKVTKNSPEQSQGEIYFHSEKKEKADKNKGMKKSLSWLV